MNKLAIWLLHAYLLAFPLAFMAVFVGYGFMMTHADPRGWLLDLVVPAIIAVAVAWALVKLARAVTRHLGAGRGWAQAFVAFEILAALALAGYLFWLGTRISVPLGILGVAAALGGGWRLIRRSEA